MAVAEVKIWRERGIAVLCKPARCLAVPLVPAGQVVDQHHARKGARAQGSGKVGVDNVPVGAVHRDGLCKHPFIHVSLVHGCSSCHLRASRIHDQSRRSPLQKSS